MSFRLVHEVAADRFRSRLAAVLAAASSADPVARAPWPERTGLVGAGLRASELCGLDISALTSEADPTLRVRGKAAMTALFRYPKRFARRSMPTRLMGIDRLFR